jgi:hypothetical protein
LWRKSEEMKNRVVGSITFALGLLVALTPRYILPVCEWAGKKPMNCGYMGRAEIFIGVIVISIAVGAFLSRGAEALRWLMLVGLVTGVMVVLLPQVLGYCPSSQMPCHYSTVPMLRLLGGLLVITSVAGIVMAKPGARENS